MNFMLTFLIFGLVCLTVNGKKPAPAKPPAKGKAPAAPPSAGFVKMDPQCLKAFRDKSIAASNVYRVKHKVGKLVSTDDKIIKIAQDYSCNLAGNFKFEHNKEATKTLGENLYVFSTTEKIGATPADCEKYAQSAVDSWYSEIKSYDFATGKSKDGGVIGHFTQLVWKGSNKVASGLCFSDKKDKKGFFWVIVVANYEPPGNMVGDYTNNVFPVGDKQTTSAPSDNMVVTSTRFADSSGTKSRLNIAFAVSTITFLMFIIFF